MFNVKQTDGILIVEDTKVITESQLKKLECKELESRIDAAAIEFGIPNWSVEATGNVYKSCVSITPESFDDVAQRALDKAHLDFLAWLDKQELSVKEKDPEGADNDDSNSFTDDEIEFLKALMEDSNDMMGAHIMSVHHNPGKGFDLGHAQMCGNTLRKLIFNALN